MQYQFLQEVLFHLLFYLKELSFKWLCGAVKMHLVTILLGIMKFLYQAGGWITAICLDSCFLLIMFDHEIGSNGANLLFYFLLLALMKFKTLSALMLLSFHKVSAIGCKLFIIQRLLPTGFTEFLQLYSIFLPFCR